MRIWRRLTHLSVVAVGAFVLSELLGAAQAHAQPPSVTVAPDSARPGQTIQIAVTGLTAQANSTLCIGIIGPGQNVELGRSPAFRLRLGQVSLDAQGSGVLVATIATTVVPGPYHIVVGGCPPQPDMAPLAALASATLTVAGESPPSPGGVAPGTTGSSPSPHPVPRGMPKTGAGGGGIRMPHAL